MLNDNALETQGMKQTHWRTTIVVKGIGEDLNTLNPDARRIHNQHQMTTLIRGCTMHTAA